MYGALKRALFLLDPERAHRAASLAMTPAHRNALVRRLWAVPEPDPRLATTAFGIAFPAPLGVAAGFDKEAHLYNALAALGFSHVELGTVTLRSQPGNPRPRVWRSPSHLALVNAMGFPGPGVDEVAHALVHTPPVGIVGANIGPNKDAPATQVPDDLASVAERLCHHTEYLAINVSSPNTPGLRALQSPSSVARLVSTVAAAADDGGAARPVLVKLHPDAPHGDLIAVAKAAVDAGAAGIIATNTTRSRPHDLTGFDAGGLSGAPLKERAVAVVGALHRALPDTPIVGVGGIQNGADAYAFIRAGASLVQTYTGFIYGGPRMAHHVHRDLVRLLDADGHTRLQDAVGTA